MVKRMVVSAVVVSLGIFAYLLSSGQKGSNLTKEEMKQIYAGVTCGEQQCCGSCLPGCIFCGFNASCPSGCINGDWGSLEKSRKYTGHGYKVCQNVSSGGGTCSNSKTWNCKYKYYSLPNCEDYVGEDETPYDSCSPGAG